jgi:hypothetical protein
MAELESVGGGFIPLIPLAIIGLVVLATSSGCASTNSNLPKPKPYVRPGEDGSIDGGIDIPIR